MAISSPPLLSPADGPAQPSVMRWQNLSAILRAVTLQGPLSRSDLAEVLGVSAGTVTRLTASLIAADVLVEVAELRTLGDNGRPRVPLDLDQRRRAVLGIHLGLEFTTLAAVDLRGGLLAERVVEHADRDPGAVLAQAEREAQRLVADLPDRVVFGAGVSSGGTVDFDSGVLVEHPALGWAGVPVRDRLAAALGLPVTYDAVVRAIALHETTYGSGRGRRHLLNVYIGNVVAAALVIEGQVHRGTGSTAGTVTHLPIPGARGVPCSCGRRNCFQVVASNLAVLAAARDAGLVAEDASYAVLQERWAGGDREVARLMRRRAGWVGQAVAQLADVVDPDVVVLSGVLARDADLLPSVRQAAVAHSALGATLGERIHPAQLQLHSLPVSSATLFLDRCFKDPVLLDPGLVRLRSNAGG